MLVLLINVLFNFSCDLYWLHLHLFPPECFLLLYLTFPYFFLICTAAVVAVCMCRCQFFKNRFEITVFTIVSIKNALLLAMQFKPCWRSIANDNFQKRKINKISVRCCNRFQDLIATQVYVHF